VEEERMKKLWIAAAAVALGLAVVAGVLWGPRLWFRLSGSTTPLGRIESVKMVDTFPEGGGYGSVSANPGHRLWVVSFTGESKRSDPEPAGGEKRPARLVDETGASYEPAMFQVTVGEGGASSTSLVFSLPEGRTPRAIRFGESEPVSLP